MSFLDVSKLKESNPKNLLTLGHIFALTYIWIAESCIVRSHNNNNKTFLIYANLHWNTANFSTVDLWMTKNNSKRRVKLMNFPSKRSNFYTLSQYPGGDWSTHCVVFNQGGTKETNLWLFENSAGWTDKYQVESKTW